ncbi:MAG: Asp-tRNA(Asn)/Glu-tRNA(Gln) amidotransferase subunit GatC [Gemmatimonadota bacterium]
MIERDEVLRIAALARLELSPEEVERMARELSQILEHVERLARVTEAAPGERPAEGTPRRQDRVASSRVVDELLEQAPAREGPLVRVPRVVE